MADAFDHCAALVRAADKDRFLATLFAPPERRDALYALYAFNVEIARVAEAVHEPMAGEVRLQWWREVLEGGRAGEAGGHPVAVALGQVIRDHRLPPDAFERLLDARRFDFGHEAMHTTEELEAYAGDTSSTVIALAARILDPEGAAAPPALAMPAGISIALAGFRRSFALQAAHGQVFLPAEVLGRLAIDPHDILAGRSSEGLKAALAWLSERAALHYETARSAVLQAPAALIPAWLPLALVPPYLAAAARDRDEPFRPVEVPQWRRQWVLWRAARSGRPRPL